MPSPTKAAQLLSRASHHQQLAQTCGYTARAEHRTATRGTGDSVHDALQDPHPLTHPQLSEAGLTPWEHLRQRLVDIFRPLNTSGRAYHYDEETAKAVLEEQLMIPQMPTVEEMVAPFENRGFR